MREPATRFDSRFSDPAAEATPWEEARAALERAELYWLTTGTNTWAEGLDVVVEGEAVRITDTAELQRIAEAIEAKYGEFWHFDVAGDAFDGQGEDPAHVFRVEPSKVLAFAKEPHAQTSYRFA